MRCNDIPKRECANKYLENIYFATSIYDITLLGLSISLNLNKVYIGIAIIVVISITIIIVLLSRKKLVEIIIYSESFSFYFRKMIFLVGAIILFFILTVLPFCDLLYNFILGHFFIRLWEIDITNLILTIITLLSLLLYYRERSIKESPLKIDIKYFMKSDDYLDIWLIVNNTSELLQKADFKILFLRGMEILEYDCSELYLKVEEGNIILSGCKIIVPVNTLGVVRITLYDPKLSSFIGDKTHIIIQANIYIENTEKHRVFRYTEYKV